MSSKTIDYCIKVNIKGYVDEAIPSNSAKPEASQTTTITADENIFKLDYDDSIDELKLPVRCWSVLRRERIRTIGDLCDKTRTELLLNYRLGESGVTIIEDTLNEHGFSLREDIKKQETDKEVHFSDLIRETPLGVRTVSLLKRAGIDTIKELCDTKKYKIHELRFFSTTCVRELDSFMVSHGYTFRPEDNDDLLYLYSDKIKMIVQDKKSAWEYRLFFELFLQNMKWLEKYRAQQTIFWRYIDDEHRIDNDRAFYECLFVKEELLSSYVDEIENVDINAVLKKVKSSGDISAIFSLNEELISIYKSIIKSRLMFKYIDADEKYRSTFELFEKAYEDLCRSFDHFCEQIIGNQAIIAQYDTGNLSKEDLTFDLVIEFDFSIDDLISEMRKIKNKDDNSNSVRVFQNDDVYIDLKSIRISKELAKISLYIEVNNKHSARIRPRIKLIRIEGRIVGICLPLGDVEAGEDKLLSYSINVDDSDGMQSVSIKFDVTDENGNLMYRSNTVNGLIKFDTEEFEFLGLE